MLAVTPTAHDTARVNNLADSLMQAISDGSDFAELAKAFSHDSTSQGSGGEMGWFSATDLPHDLAGAIAGWSDIGQIKGPVSSSQGIHIFKLLHYTPEKTLDIIADFDRIKDMAREEKSGRMVEAWIQELRSKSYIDIRVPGNAN
jgi:parvulin-like peptidyl-prolyl isomerase